MRCENLYVFSLFLYADVVVFREERPRRLSAGNDGKEVQDCVCVCVNFTTGNENWSIISEFNQERN